MPKTTESSWQETHDDKADDFPGKPSRWRTSLSRVVIAYLGLFLGLSLFMSILGLDPLLHNGALPQCLLVIVGLALILALASGETNLVDEQARSWLVLFSRRPLPEDAQQRGHQHDGHPQRW
jgi:peptidoglycan/LPS O-acetylase OafA/YrhL